MNWFRAYEASARHLSFTAAAQELHLTQSAVSQQVKSLEIRFGVSLFKRLPRGIALTDEGRRLLPEVSSALGVLTEVANRYEHDEIEGQLTVATSVSFIQWVITPAISRPKSKYSSSSLRLISAIWPDEFRQSDADIEIRFGSDELVGENAERLLPDELIVVASPALDVNENNLSSCRLIETVGTSDGWKQWALRAKYPETPVPEIFVDYHGAALDLAVSGAGVALTSSLLAHSSISEGRLIKISSISVQSSDGYFLSVRDQDSESAVSFVEWLKSELTSFTVCPS